MLVLDCKHAISKKSTPIFTPITSAHKPEIPGIQRFPQGSSVRAQFCVAGTNRSIAPLLCFSAHVILSAFVIRGESTISYFMSQKFAGLPRNRLFRPWFAIGTLLVLLTTYAFLSPWPNQIHSICTICYLLCLEYQNCQPHIDVHQQRGHKVSAKKNPAPVVVSWTASFKGPRRQFNIQNTMRTYKSPTMRNKRQLSQPRYTQHYKPS